MHQLRFGSGTGGGGAKEKHLLLVQVPLEKSLSAQVGFAKGRRSLGTKGHKIFREQKEFCAPTLHLGQVKNGKT